MGGLMEIKKNDSLINSHENEIDPKLEKITKILLRRFRELEVDSDSKSTKKSQKEEITKLLKGEDFL
jgi:hypothetical protein